MLDWTRIDDWSARLVAGDVEAFADAFASHGAVPPQIVWNPTVERLGSEPLRFLRTHWDGLARDVALPHIKQIDPIDLQPGLGYVTLLDVIDDGRDFRYRLFGSIVTSISGFDMTGRLLSEHRASPLVTEFAFVTYRAALRRREPIYTERIPTGAAQTTIWQHLVLPLADDTGAVVRFLSGTMPIARDGTILRTPY